MENAPGDDRTVKQLKKTDYSFPKQHRLLKRSEFLTVNQYGNTLRGSWLMARVRKNGAPCSRLGITVSKRVGRAARRNRIKRLVREYFRRNRHTLAESWDINIIAKNNASDVTSREIIFSMEEIFNKLQKL